MKSYEASLKRKPAKVRKALLNGDWYVGDGFGAEWKPDAKPKRRKRIPKNWTKIRVRP